MGTKDSKRTSSNSMAGGIPKILRSDGIDGKLTSLCEKNDIVFMGLFGSYARNDQKKRSDVDIAVEFGRKGRQTLLSLVRLENELSNLFGKKVDLGTLSSVNIHVRDSVLKDMKILYEKR